MAKKGKNSVVALYLRDAEFTKSLIREVSQLYYEIYHEYPTQGEMINKALIMSKDILAGKNKINSSTVKIDDMYGRV